MSSVNDVCIYFLFSYLATNRLYKVYGMVGIVDKDKSTLNKHQLPLHVNRIFTLYDVTKDFSFNSKDPLAADKFDALVARDHIKISHYLNLKPTCPPRSEDIKDDHELLHTMFEQDYERE